MNKGLEEYFFHRIDRFTRFYKCTIMDFHRKQSVKGLSPLEFAILNEIASPEKKQISAVAERMNLSMPNCSRYVRWLIEGGYVEKIQDLEDKRVFYIRPTDKGKKIIKNALQETKKRAMNFIVQFNQKEIEKIIESMDFIEESFSRVHED